MPPPNSGRPERGKTGYLPAEVRQDFIVYGQPRRAKEQLEKEPEHFKGKIISWEIPDLLPIRKKAKHPSLLRSALGLWAIRYLLIGGGFIYVLEKKNSIYRVCGIWPFASIFQVYLERHDPRNVRFVLRRGEALVYKDLDCGELRGKLLQTLIREFEQSGYQLAEL
jgi:hypothetical protein